MLRTSARKLIETANHRVWFQQPIKTRDGIGGFTTVWESFLPRYVAIQPMTADQQFKYRSVNVDATHIVKVRGYLDIPTAVKRIGTTWAITWTAFADCTTVKIEYSVNDGTFVSITASTANDGSHNWTIPTEARGDRVYVRVTNNQNTTVYSDTDQYLVIPTTVTATTVDESFQILWGTRTFEILTIEDLQERNFVKLITCKERR